MSYKCSNCGIWFEKPDIEAMPDNVIFHDEDGDIRDELFKCPHCGNIFFFGIDYLQKKS